MSCVFRKKSKRKNTNRKLVGMCRGEKCVFGMKGKRKNTCRVFLGRKVSGETQNRSLLVCAGKKIGREEKLASGRTHGVGVGGSICVKHIFRMRPTIYHRAKAMWRHPRRRKASRKNHRKET